MTFKNTQTEYGFVAKSFHWIVALLMIALIGVGWVMTDMADSPFKYQVYGFHKAFGITVLFLAAARLLWRLYNPAPAGLGSHAPWEKKLAKVIHGFFYFSIIAMPIIGWALSSSAGYPVSWFGLFNLPAIVPADKEMTEVFRDLHGLLGTITAACIALHFAGALKHHVIDRDTTLARMVPFLKPRT